MGPAMISTLAVWLQHFRHTRSLTPSIMRRVLLLLTCFSLSLAQNLTDAQVAIVVDRLATSAKQRCATNIPASTRRPLTTATAGSSARGHKRSSSLTRLPSLSSITPQCRRQLVHRRRSRTYSRSHTRSLQIGPRPTMAPSGRSRLLQMVQLVTQRAWVLRCSLPTGPGRGTAA